MSTKQAYPERMKSRNLVYRLFVIGPGALGARFGGIMWKVEYIKLAYLDDDRVGNVSQGNGTAYMECALESVPVLLMEYLKDKNLYPAIQKSERIDGHIVTQ
jgi:hypothetical protein